MNRQVSALLVLVALFGQQACKSDGGTEPPPSPIPTSVQISQTTVSLTALGAQATLSATVRDQNNNPIGGASVIWSSDDTDVVTVNASGTVTAVGVGSTTIRATSGSASGTATVMVSQQPAAAEPVGGNAQSGTVGQALGMALTVQINDAGGNPIPSVSVSFVVTSGGGSVADPTVPTDATGQASTTWTLGLTAGEQQVSASIEGGGPVGTFTATATADVAFSIAEVSGNMQQGPTGAQLPDPIVVKVADQFGNGVQGEAVAFAITDGGDGSLVSNLEITDDQGEASTQWTLSSSEGPNSAEASAAGLSGDPVMFTATGTNLAVTGVSPDPMIEGGTATISGNGFSPVPGNTTVTVDGVSANVTSVLLNTIEIDVPTYDCQPARLVDVVVTVSGVSEDISHELNPTAFLSVPVGQQLMIQDPDEFCLQFDESAAGGDEYVLGLSAAAETPTAALPFSVTSVAPPTTSPPATLPPSARAAGRSMPVLDRELLTARASQLRAEARLRAWERENLDPARNPSLRVARAPGAQAAQVVPAVGDTLLFRVPDLDGNACEFTEITTVVRVVGSKGIIVSDTANPTTDSLTLAEMQAASDTFDLHIFDTDTLYLGAPTDLDTNARVVVVLTIEVNKFALGAAGFVFSGDLFDRGTCASSDGGEIFYSHVPDPNNAGGQGARSRASVLGQMASLIAHEFAHNIQQGRRLIVAGGSTGLASWESEGQASLVEEVVGHSVLGNMPGQNYGSGVARGAGAGAQWYENLFLRLAQYYGWQGGTSKAEDAPDDCTLFGSTSGPTTPCNVFSFYGASFSFQRFVADQFGPTYPGGETALTRDWITKSPSLSGVENVEALLGVQFDSLFARWAAMLYADDRVPGVDPSISMISWDMFDIFGSFSSDALRLVPVDLSFADFSDTGSVRGGSTAFARLSAAGPRSALAFRVRDLSDAILDTTLKPVLWIVRLQ